MSKSKDPRALGPIRARDIPSELLKFVLVVFGAYKSKNCR